MKFGGDSKRRGLHKRPTNGIASIESKEDRSGMSRKASGLNAVISVILSGPGNGTALYKPYNMLLCVSQTIL